MKLFDGRRGYVRFSVTPERLQADYRVVPLVTRPDGSVETSASFVVENGRPQLVRS
jgi:alkaline phosphatase D